MGKNSFDVALMPGVRELLKKAYIAFREVHLSSDKSELDEAGLFLQGSAYSRTCPICMSEESTLQFFTRGMHVVTCNSCELTYSQEVFTRLADKSRYENSNFMSQYREIKNNAIYSQLEAQKAEYIMSVAGKFALTKARMLDVGSSNGKILESATRQGWASHGIEVNADLAAESIEKGLNAVQGYFPEDMPNGWSSFDLVTMLDVLEHVVQPLELLKDASRYIEVGGLIVIQVPNYNSLLIRLEGAANSNFCHGHWSFFEPDTLDRTMAIAGFEKLFLETIISELDRIVEFDLDKIRLAIRCINGEWIDSLEQLTAGYLHQYLLGYKLLGVYRKK